MKEIVGNGIESSDDELKIRDEGEELRQLLDMAWKNTEEMTTVLKQLKEDVKVLRVDSKGQEAEASGQLEDPFIG